MSRLVRPLGNDAPDGALDDCFELLDLLRRGPKVREVWRAEGYAAQIFPKSIFERSLYKDVVVKDRSAIINPFLFA